MQDGKVLLKDGMVAMDEACCCGGQCCGIPKNCTVTVSVNNDYVYDQATGLWSDANNNQWGITFGDCQGASGSLGNEYATCCVWYSNGATPIGGNPNSPCILYSAYLVGRIVCDSCCDAEPEFQGDANEYGVNCRIEGMNKAFNQVGDCSAFQAALDFPNWDITINCDPAPDPCNPLP